MVFYVTISYMYSPLSWAFDLVAFVNVAYSKVFQLQNDFLKKFCGSFGISLFVSSDTYKGKAAYKRKQDHTERCSCCKNALFCDVE